MIKIARSCVSAAVLAALLHAAPAQAQTAPIRVFVALTGSDSNPCTFASPCKSAQHAHDVVAAGGEMRMLDPGSYGLLTITKAISILGDGHGGIAASNGATAITINAGATDKINLRGLVIEGFGTGGNGIIFNTGASLDIQDSFVRNFTINGIQFTPSAASDLKASQTLVSDLAGQGSAVLISPSGTATVNAVLDDVELDHGFIGLFVQGSDAGANLNVTVSDSIISNCFSNGIEAHTNGGNATIDVRDSTVATNGNVGVYGAVNAVRLTRSQISGNRAGWAWNVFSYGDNEIEDNTNVNTAPSGIPHK